MIHCMQARNTLVHSISHYRIVYACVFLLLISRPSWALPITFEFAGTINVPILDGAPEDPLCTLDNRLTYPQQNMSFKLTSLDENARFLTSSADFNDVSVQPQFSNHANADYVSYYTTPSVGRIDSLNRITDVPEPKGLTLILLAIGSYAIARLRGMG